MTRPRSITARTSFIAAATSISLVFETVLLFAIVRRRLGLHVLAFGSK